MSFLTLVGVEFKKIRRSKIMRKAVGSNDNRDENGGGRRKGAAESRE